MPSVKVLGREDHRREVALHQVLALQVRVVAAKGRKVFQHLKLGSHPLLEEPSELSLQGVPQALLVLAHLRKEAQAQNLPVALDGVPVPVVLCLHFLNQKQGKELCHPAVEILRTIELRDPSNQRGVLVEALRIIREKIPAHP